MTQLTEVFQGRGEHPALFQERDVLESLSPETLRAFIEECEAKQAEIERLKVLATEVLSGYGEELAA